MYASFENTLDVELMDGVLWLTKINARSGHGISRAMYHALHQTLSQAATDPDLRAIVLAVRDGAFQHGAVLISQIKDRFEDLDTEDFRTLVAMGQDLADLIAKLPVATIAVVPAGALGGSLELLLRCDFIYCTHDAQFRLPEVQLGLLAAWSGVQVTSRSASYRKVQEFILLGRTIDGTEAEDIELVTRSFADQKLLNAYVTTVLQELRTCSPAAFRATKQSLADAWESPFSKSHATARERAIACMETGDFLKGVPAFSEGRAHDYTAHNDQD